MLNSDSQPYPRLSLPEQVLYSIRSEHGELAAPDFGGHENIPVKVAEEPLRPTTSRSRTSGFGHDRTFDIGVKIADKFPRLASVVLRFSWNQGDGWRE
jgi:hypothetical protein